MDIQVGLNQELRFKVLCTVITRVHVLERESTMMPPNEKPRVSWVM